MLDCILKGARVVDPVNHLDRVTDVGIENGKIAAVGDNLGSAKETVSLDGLVLILISTLDPNSGPGTASG